MTETIEFRFSEDDAKRYFGPGDGVRIGIARKIEVDTSDRQFARVGEIERSFRKKGEAFFTAWIPHRRYTKLELQSAAAFLVKVKCIFEPAGEECGTIYDESTACQFCGCGATRRTDLILDAKKLPKRGNLAMAQTIASELIVSKAFVDVFQGNRLRGAEFRAVKQKRDPSIVVPDWFEPIMTSVALRIVAPTRAGIDPFDDGSRPSSDSAKIFAEMNIDGSWCDQNGQYRCPKGHTIGLNLLSELSVSKSDFDNWDIAATSQCVGVRRGLLRPEPLLVISPRFWRLLEAEGLKGMAFEIAHLQQ